MKRIISFLLAAVMLVSSAGLLACKVKTDPANEVTDNDNNKEGESGSVTLYDLLTDDMRAPVGIDSKKPLFSWKMDSAAIGQRQTAYQIRVTDEDGKAVWDSGKTESSDSVDIVYGGDALVSSTAYKWELTVWDKDGKENTASSTFETGLLENKPFASAPFISCDETLGFTDTVYTIDFDFILEKSNTGFCFGAKDGNNLIMWQINTSETAGDPLYLRPHVKSGGNWSTFGGNISISAALGVSGGSAVIGKTLHERIEVNGKQIVTYLGLDGGELKQVSSISYSSTIPLGLIAFRHHGDVQEGARYDNIVIKDANGNVLYENDFSGSYSGFDANGKLVDGMLSVNAQSGEVVCVQTGDTPNLPAYRKSFTPAKELKSAKLYTTALGVYESYINGERVGRLLEDGSVEYHELKPGFTEMGTRKYYSSYDVTHLIKSGENVLSAVVTSGWWSGLVAANYGKETAYAAILKLKFTDGSEDVITTGTDWKASRAAPVTMGDIYNGESYDARTDLSWMLPGFDDSDWQNARKNTEFKGTVEAWKGSYITVRSDLERAAASVTVYNGATGSSSRAYGKINIVSTYDKPEFTLKPGEVALIDFGQNFSGWECFTVKGNAGTVLTIEHGEILNDQNGEMSRGNDGPGGSIYNANYRSARATTTYTLRGGDAETYHPSNTYYGFRYIEISATETVTFSAITGQVVTSVTEDTGFIETSDGRINQLISNIRWGQYSNYLSVPTDCPQRDERMGWTADTQVFAQAGCYLGMNKSFLEKFLQDLRDAQRTDGSYPGVAPTGQYGGADYGGTGWADAGIIVPYILYTMYDDLEAVEDSWKSMQKYVDNYLGATNKRGPRNVWGDWLAYESNDATIQSMLAVCYYAWDALMMSEMAAALGKDSDAAKYQQLYQTEKEFFIEQYVTKNGSLSRGEQTACLYALYLDLLPDENSVSKVIGQLERNIQSTGNRLQTGFLGTKIILDTFTKIGRTDIAYSLLLQDANPSWLYSVDQGATTIWERWNSYTKESGFGDVSMNSFNHYAYGAVASWMFSTMAGIGVDTANPGFKNIIIAPVSDTRIRTVNATYDSAYGKITASSDRTDTAWTYSFTIPANTTSDVSIPLSGGTLTVGGKPVTDLTEADGITYLGTENGVARFTTVSGSFEFVITY